MLKEHNMSTTPDHLNNNNNNNNIHHHGLHHNHHHHHIQHSHHHHHSHHGHNRSSSCSPPPPSQTPVSLAGSDLNSSTGSTNSSSPAGGGVGANAATMQSPSGGGGGGGNSNACCGGCGHRISDRYYLMAVDRQWHAGCLKCAECRLPLDGELTCFARSGNIYCKEDYYRMFAVRRCGRCHTGISANELVMRARDLVYHLHCFTCTSCGIALAKGDHFGMREGLVYCRPHFELLDFCEPMEMVFNDGDKATSGGNANTASSTPIPGAGGDSPGYYTCTPPPQPHHPHHHGGPPGKGRPRKRKPESGDITMLDGSVTSLSGNGGTGVGNTGSGVGGAGGGGAPQGPMGVAAGPGMTCADLPVAMRMAAATLEMLQGDLSSASMDSLSYDSSVTSPASSTGGHHAQRTKRMRTSFKHHQLRTMKTYFAINQNPDAKDLKQLALKTGLSKRVLQVWFQNARAKWRRNMMRQEGGHTGSSPGASVGGNPGGLLNDSNGLSHQSMEDIHHHLHANPPGQTLNFGDIY